MATGGTAKMTMPWQRRAALLMEHANEYPKKHISNVVATAMSLPLVDATAPARPMSIPSIIASTTTAMIRPMGTAGVSSLFLRSGFGAQRRNVAFSAAEW
eukprot:CAMPEP_0198594274 /NCGR_PEP_ID=MMETSP1462-20131121/140435_1 /TAXON_ID=1333877 /ORGANISM="Brandtodinium nutriculum, Strain RCC3387" /LENGTH=99 /DNA_ID=CAMNT_0044325891 /DNA_START=148 /DNA_END=444 /DNA_ORIENTATION=+